MLVSLSPENVSKWSKDFLFLFLKSVLVRWMKLEPIIQSEVRQKEKHEYSMLLLLLSHFSRVWLCDPTDGSSPGTAIPEILQARTLEWIAISFSNAWKWKVKVKSLSCVQLSATPWTSAHQAPPSMGFSRQEYWSRVPLASPYDGPSYTLKVERRRRMMARWKSSPY